MPNDPRKGVRAGDATDSHAEAIDHMAGGLPHGSNRVRHGSGVAGRAAVVWALLGVTLLFGRAVFGLGRRGIETVGHGLDPVHWVLLVVLTLAFVYTEGILTFQNRWVPDLMIRVQGLRDERQARLRLLAPLYGLSLIGASRGRTLRAWAVVVAIVVAVRVVGTFPEPWRGIVDFAVAAALLWGLVAILWQGRGALR